MGTHNRTARVFNHLNPNKLTRHWTGVPTALGKLVNSVVINSPVGERQMAGDKEQLFKTVRPLNRHNGSQGSGKDRS